MANDLRERPIGELLRELSEQTQTLVRQELDLAKAELSQKGKEAGVGAGMFGGAGVFGLLFLAALSATAVIALDSFMKLWLAALVVALVHAAIAGVLALQGKNRLQNAAPVMPEQTVETVKEDVQWAKSRATSGSR